MIAEVLRRLDVDRGTCVEVGAHDGFTFSNTARLWHEQGWRAVLIEPDEERFLRLVERTRGHDATPIRSFVGPDGPERLDRVLEAAGAPGAIELLSIDVDGGDLAILRSLAGTAIRARVLLCEYNPTIPWDLSLEGEAGSPAGASLGTVVSAAGEQGYRLIGVTATNAIFVGEGDASLFADIETSLAAVADRSGYTYVITDYAGRSTIIGPLPFRFRPGHPRFQGRPGRRDLRVRWSLVGALRELRFRFGTARALMQGRPPSGAARAVLKRVRRR